MSNVVKRPKVLFLCTGNSCRSQMAEGWARHLLGKTIEPFSAGTETHGLNPSAVQVMADAGVDISHHKSKTLDELSETDFDLVVAVCADADEHCPVFSGKTIKLHHSFDDPPKIAETLTSEKDKLACYRRVRDEIEQFVRTIPEILTKNSG